MKQLLFLLCIFSLFIMSACDTPSGLPANEPSALPASANLGDDMPATIADLYAAHSDELGAELYLVSFKNQKGAAFRDDVAAAGGSVYFMHEATGIAIVRDLSVEGLVALKASKTVSDLISDDSFPLGVTADEANAEMASGLASATNPTAANFYARQWNMRAIEADAAWSAGRHGSSDVTLAILDTGIDYTYHDLVGKVDLSRSVSFVPDDDFFTDLFFPGKHPVTDLHYHGTHVSSTAVSNSDVVAGVTQNTTLIGVKVCSVLGGCSFAAIVAGVLHAADNGADVANMSLGGAFTKAGNGKFVGFINKVFNYANQKKMTVVVSAGNSAFDLDHNGNVYATYCDTPNTICVSATGPADAASVNGPWVDVDAPASYTNYGSSAINVGAPGGTAHPSGAPFNLVWAGCSSTSLVVPVCQTGTFIIALGGTSMASPHVSGLASLLVEDIGRNPGRIKTKLQQGADDLGKKGTDPFYGKGRINVANTLGL